MFKFFNLRVLIELSKLNASRTASSGVVSYPKVPLIILSALLSMNMAISIGNCQEESDCSRGIELEIFSDGDDSPDNGEKDFLMGALYFGQDEFEKALHHLDLSIAKGRLSSEAYLLRGICHLHMDCLEEAQSNFQIYSESDPEKAESLNVAGKLLYAFGYIDAAEEAFRTALKEDERNAAVYSNLGSVLIEKMQLDEARICFSRALEYDPNLSEAHINLGILYFILEDFFSAEESFLEAIRINQESGIWDPIPYANLGDLYFVVRDMDACIKSYTISLNIDPNISDIRTRLGMAFQLQGQTGLAREQFERAIDIGSEPPEAHAGLAAILYDAGSVLESMSEYRKAIQKSRQTDADSMIALAGILMAMERSEEALYLFRKAYLLGEDHPRVLADISRLCETCGFEEEAIAFHRLLVDKDPGNSIAQFETARRSVDSEIKGIFNPDRAIDITEHLAAETEWKHPGILEVLALAYFHLGDFDKAVEMESLAIQALPEGNPLADSMKIRLQEYTVKGK